MYNNYTDIVHNGILIQNICTGLEVFWDDVPKKKSRVRTGHPPTSIVISDFWNSFFFAQPLNFFETKYRYTSAALIRVLDYELVCWVAPSTGGFSARFLRIRIWHSLSWRTHLDWSRMSDRNVWASSLRRTSVEHAHATCVKHSAQAFLTPHTPSSHRKQNLGSLHMKQRQHSYISFLKLAHPDVQIFLKSLQMCYSWPIQMCRYF